MFDHVLNLKKKTSNKLFVNEKFCEINVCYVYSISSEILMFRYIHRITVVHN